MDEGGEGVGRLAVKQDIQLDELGRAEARDMVVERSVALGDGLELVVKVEDNFRQGHIVVEFHPVRSDVVLAHKGAPLVQAELHYGAEEFGLGNDLGTDEWFLDVVYKGRGGEAGRVVHVHNLALHSVNLVRYVGDGGDDVHIELPEKPFLHYFKVQEPQEAAAEAGAQRQGTFRLVHEGRIVQLEFFQGGAEFFELVRLHRIHSGEYHRLHFLEAGDGLRTGVVRVGDCVSHLNFSGVLDARDDIAYVSAVHLSRGDEFHLEDAHFVRDVFHPGVEELDAVALADGSVLYLEVCDDAAE